MGHINNKKSRFEQIVRSKFGIQSPKLDVKEI